MTLDLTDWAMLLEALDGKTAPPPSLPPLPTISAPFDLPTFFPTSKPRRYRVSARRVPPSPIPKSQ